MTTVNRVPARLVVACAVLTAMLVGAGEAAAAFGDRALRPGMEGRDVAQLQRKLTRLGLETPQTGYYGTVTTGNMKRYERRNDRRVNGWCSRADADHIQRSIDALPDDGGSTGGDSGYGSRTMYSGMSGSDVSRLQRLLTETGLATPVTGTYDGQTRMNVRLWEAWRYARANGKVEPDQARRIAELASQGAQYVRRDHVFPVRGPHDYGGAGSRFGAPRSGHTHQGQDISAAHGTKLVAVHDGRVAYRQYQEGGAGHYLVIHGDDGSDSVYMHMARRGVVAPGTRVLAGEKIGVVGSTGSSTGPHLHFELWTPHWYDGGSPYDPLPKLRAWDERT